MAAAGHVDASIVNGTHHHHDDEDEEVVEEENEEEEEDDEDESYTFARREETAWSRAGYTEGFAEGASERGEDVEEAARRGFDEGFMEVVTMGKQHEELTAFDVAYNAAETTLSVLMEKQRIERRMQKTQLRHKRAGDGEEEEEEGDQSAEDSFDEQKRQEEDQEEEEEEDKRRRLPALVKNIIGDSE